MKAAALDHLKISLDVIIRPCVEEDLHNLEWFGMFSEHREIIHKTFDQHRHGKQLMLVADANGFPIGQTWIDLRKKKDEFIGVIWAARVLPCFQCLGIGSKLIASAERELRERGFKQAEIGVELQNPRAARLYERLGYRISERSFEEYAFTTPDGVSMRVPIDQWLMRKDLNTSKRGANHERKKK